MLADIEELTVPEIAELTQTPVNTVYTRLRRAREDFQRAWSLSRRRGP
jgi:RNA polymerase sigma-70 factor (ECF subfamily)